MHVDHDQSATGSQCLVGGACPGVEVADPGEHPVGGNHEIETTDQVGGQVRDVGLDEPGRQTRLLGESLGPADRDAGEVQAGDPGS